MKKRLSNSLHEILMELELTKLNILTENQLPLKKSNNKTTQQKQEQKTFYNWGHLILLQPGACTIKVINGIRW